MGKVSFLYNGLEYVIECDDNDKFKIIIDKFFNKICETRRNIYLLYNGVIINEELPFYKCLNNTDKIGKFMKVIVYESQDSDSDKPKIIKSKYIICPKCKENAYLSINNFKISIFGCIFGHETNEIKINEFEKTQFIDLTKIKCFNCHKSKYESSDNNFFKCNLCKKNLCSTCKEYHESTHKDYIKFDEEKQFYCEIHNDKYIDYCTDCKKDICKLCQKDHTNHNLLILSGDMPSINTLKKVDSNDTYNKVEKIKNIISDLIEQLNLLNNDLDKYFGIYYDLTSCFEQNESNKYILQNIINMKKYNDNFLGNLSEIIQDKSIKSQFYSIINLCSKMEFKKINKKIEINQNDENKNGIIEINTNITKTENNIINNNTVNDNNISRIKYNSLNDTYENFSIERMKELQTFNPKNNIKAISILNDGRIITYQLYQNEKGNECDKLCVYSIKDGFICDINVDIENSINEFFSLDDGNVILFKSLEINIIKVKKDSIEQIWKEKNFYLNNKLLNGNFLITYGKKDEMKGLYKYENCALKQYKDLKKIYEKENVYCLCQLTENEYVFSSRRKGLLFGYKCYLIFYDIQNDKTIKSLKLGDDKNYYGELFLLNKENLIVSGYNMVGLIDIKNRKVKTEFKYKIIFEDIILLNYKQFLYKGEDTLSLFELEEPNNLKLKEKKELDITLVSKYPGNKLIFCFNNGTKIALYGYN